MGLQEQLVQTRMSGGEFSKYLNLRYLPEDDLQTSRRLAERYDSQTSARLQDQMLKSAESLTKSLEAIAKSLQEIEFTGRRREMVQRLTPPGLGPRSKLLLVIASLSAAYYLGSHSSAPIPHCAPTAASQV